MNILVQVSFFMDIVYHFSYINAYEGNCWRSDSSPKVFIILHSHQQCLNIPDDPHLCQHLVLSDFLIWAILVRVRWYSVGLKFHLTDDGWWWKVVSYGYLYIFLWDVSIQNFCRYLLHFYYWWFVVILDIFWICVLGHLSNIFQTFFSVICLFIFFMESYDDKTFLVLIKSSLLICFFFFGSAPPPFFLFFVFWSYPRTLCLSKISS